MERIEVSVDKLIGSSGLESYPVTLSPGFEPFSTVVTTTGAYLISVKRTDTDSDREKLPPPQPLSEIGDGIEVDPSEVVDKLISDALSRKTVTSGPKSPDWPSTCGSCWRAMEKLTIAFGPGHCLQCKCCIEES